MLIGGVLVLAAVFFWPLLWWLGLPVSGYGLRIMRATARGEAPSLPEWKDWADLFLDGLRVWVELGFRALKGMGWRWEHTRRVDPTRVGRHWLVLAVAMLWVLAYGTRAEDAEGQGLPPAKLHHPPKAPAQGRRAVSVFQRGLTWLGRQLGKARLWRRLWLAPEPWPESPIALQLTYHGFT